MDRHEKEGRREQGEEDKEEEEGRACVGGWDYAKGRRGRKEERDWK